MANRSTGQIILNANFEVGYLGPLDARVTTPELAHLTNPASGADGTYLPLPLLGLRFLQIKMHIFLLLLIRTEFRLLICLMEHRIPQHLRQ